MAYSEYLAYIIRAMLPSLSTLMSLLIKLQFWLPYILCRLSPDLSVVSVLENGLKIPVSKVRWI